jgi:mono/diheme cytochrome c family protein
MPWAGECQSEPTYRVKGANITPDRDTGIGTWSADDIKRAMTEGIRPAQARLSGVPLAPIMPWAFHKILTPRDLDAVVAYVQIISPVRNEVPPPLYRAPMPVELVPGGEKPIAEAALRDPLRRGFYLVTIAHCMECHARRPDGTHDFVNWLGKGGHEMTGPYGSVIVRNITSDKTVGIGAWTDADIKRALTQGVSRDGRVFKPPMARQTFFSRMTEPDIDAIIAYLRTLPSLK